jgi:hypothetical protein
VASTGNVWGSGRQVGDAHPATEGDLKNRVGHGEGGHSWEGLQKGRGSSAPGAIEVCEGDLACNGGGSCLISRVLWVAWAAAAECIRCARARKASSCAAQSCVRASGSTVWTTCLASDQMAAGAA